MLTSELEAQVLSAEVKRLRRVIKIKDALICALLGLLVCAGIVVAAMLLSLQTVTP